MTTPKEYDHSLDSTESNNSSVEDEEKNDENVPLETLNESDDNNNNNVDSISDTTRYPQLPNKSNFHSSSDDDSITNNFMLVFRSPFTYLTVWGALQTVVSIVFGPHYIGTAVGILLGCIGMIGLSYTLDLLYQTIANALRKRTKIQKIIALTGILLLFLFSFLFIIIYILNGLSAPTKSLFPIQCEKTTNCVRLTPNNATNNKAENLQVPFVSSISNIVIKFKAKTWAKQYGQYAVIYEDAVILHLKFISVFWGFADDFFLSIDGTMGSYTLSVQSASRIGTDDFGENRKRVVSFLGYIFPFTSSVAQLMGREVPVD